MISSNKTIGQKTQNGLVEGISALTLVFRHDKQAHWDPAH